MQFLGYVWRPQGDSNPRYRRERAVSWAGLDDGDVGFRIVDFGLRIELFPCSFNPDSAICNP